MRSRMPGRGHVLAATRCALFERNVSNTETRLPELSSGIVPVAREISRLRSATMRTREGKSARGGSKIRLGVVGVDAETNAVTRSSSLDATLLRAARRGAL